MAKPYLPLLITQWCDSVMSRMRRTLPIIAPERKKCTVNEDECLYKVCQTAVTAGGLFTDTGINQ